MSSAQSRFRELDSLLACDELMRRLEPVDRQHLIDCFEQRNRKSAAQAEKYAPAQAEKYAPAPAEGDIVITVGNDSIPLAGDAPFECIIDRDSPYWKDLAPTRCQSCHEKVLGGGFCRACKASFAPCRFCRCHIPKTNKAAKYYRGGRCSSCFGVVYCSRECQRGDWPRHKQVCPGYLRGKIIDLRYVQGHL